MTRKFSLALVSIGGILLVVMLRMIVAAKDRSATPVAASAFSAPSVEATDVPRPPVKISAADLYSAFDLNGVAANDQYSGRQLEVSGVLSGKKIGQQGSGVHLHLKADQSGLEYVDAILGQPGQLAAPGLRNGDAVTVDCDQVQRSMGSLTLSDCMLVSGLNHSTGE